MWDYKEDLKAISRLATSLEERYGWRTAANYYYVWKRCLRERRFYVKAGPWGLIVNSR